MNSLFTVIGFTFKNKVKSKAFLITSLILLVLLSIVVNIPYMIQSFSNDDPKRIGMFQDSDISNMLKAFQENQEKEEFEIIFMDALATPEQNEKLIKEEINSGTIDGFLQLVDNPDHKFPDVIYKSDGSLDFTISSILKNALSAIKTELTIQELNLTLTDEQREGLFGPIDIETIQISTSASGEKEDKSDSEQTLTFGLVYILIILFFMGTMITGQFIATEITAEKSNRVMEVLVTSVSPMSQMFGKIIGMFLLGISQILLFVAVFIANLLLPHNLSILEGFEIDLTQIPSNLIIYFIVFYLLGYFLYATIFAAIGSIVSRTEDLGQAIMPVTFLSLAAFYIGIFGMAQPTSTFMTSMSFVPFFTPITMFIRIGLAEPAAWEIVLSFAMLILTILFMGWISAKIYRTGVLMYGKRPSIKEIRKAMKSFNVR